MKEIGKLAPRVQRADGKGHLRLGRHDGSRVARWPHEWSCHEVLRDPNRSRHPGFAWLHKPPDRQWRQRPPRQIWPPGSERHPISDCAKHVSKAASQPSSSIVQFGDRHMQIVVACTHLEMHPCFLLNVPCLCPACVCVPEVRASEAAAARSANRSVARAASVN